MWLILLSHTSTLHSLPAWMKLAIFLCGAWLWLRVKFSIHSQARGLKNRAGPRAGAAKGYIIICLSSLNSLLREEILVHIRQPEGTPLNHFRRIIWCPFIPEESEDCCEESSPTVALLHEDRVRGLAMVKEGSELPYVCMD